MAFCESVACGKLKLDCKMAMNVMYNGVHFAPVSNWRSIVLSHPAEIVWGVVGEFGKQAVWMGSVGGQPCCTQLLVCLMLKPSRAVTIKKTPHDQRASGFYSVCFSSSNCKAESQAGQGLQGGETADYVGAARVFGIADKVLFEQLTG